MTEIVSNSITIFKQAVAPVGWTKLTDINDCTLRVINNVYQTQGGGTIPVSTFFTTPQTKTAPINVTGYVNPAKAELPAHKHVYGKSLTGDLGTIRSVDRYGYPSTRFQFQTQDINSKYTEGITEEAGGIGSLTYTPGPAYNPWITPYYGPGDCNPHTHQLSGQISMSFTTNNLDIKYVDVIRAKKN